jgi:alanine racemase
MTGRNANANASSPPFPNIVVPKPPTNTAQAPPPPENLHRAVHKIRYGALFHNYGEVETAANRQRCSVIVVVKADGYGHGAIHTAISLADHVGADAFAVATLEEGIALRKAFQQTDHAMQFPTNPSLARHSKNNSNNNNNNNTSTPHMNMNMNNLFDSPDIDDSISAMTSSASVSMSTKNRSVQNQNRRRMRSSQIRILVLGPPVGFPRCLDDYYHWGIECMVSGPEVARGLVEWVLNTDQRKRTMVERAATMAKQQALFRVAPPRTSALQVQVQVQVVVPQPPLLTKSQENSMVGAISSSSSSSSSNASPYKEEVLPEMTTMKLRPLSATLGNVSGQDLANEVRQILMTQQQHQQQHHQQQQQQQQSIISRQVTLSMSGSSTPGATPPKQRQSNDNQSLVSSSIQQQPQQPQQQPPPLHAAFQTLQQTQQALAAAAASQMQIYSNPNNNQKTPSAPTPPSLFAGIEEAAKYSRTRVKLAQSQVFQDQGHDDDDNDDNGNPAVYSLAPGTRTGTGTGAIATPHVSTPIQLTNGNNANANANANGGISSSNTTSSGSTNNSNNSNVQSTPSPLAPISTIARKQRLRWHALVDSGMGRLGFRTDPVSKDEQGKRRDSVEILKELVDMENSLKDCPIEFYGMCTHMAEASATSDYSNAQIAKFKLLLKRVRAAGISVPTVSTDNSAALLTTNLTHFDAPTLLRQPHADTRGYVRIGGAIYGQRPSFPQLRAVSTLMASVRHVATLKQGESVGYDRAYIAPMNVRIATITIGFADGYPRELGNGVGNVNIRGHLFPVVGNVCMDMLMVELGPATSSAGDPHCASSSSSAGAQVVVGDTAILWGPADEEEGEGLVRLQDLASTLKTTQSALTCGLDKIRVLRQYG